MTSQYYSFFGLDNATFAPTSDANYVFAETSFRSVLLQIVDGFQRGKPIAIVTGQIGTGKTTLCHFLAEKLTSCNLVSVNVNPLYTTSELLATICDGLNIDYPRPCRDETIIFNRLREFFATSDAKGERTIVILDEAQNIGYDFYQHLAGLTNSKTPKTKKHHIILTGRPELIEYLETIGFHWRSHKDTILCELDHMDKQDTIDYIRHRLATGGATEPIFTSDAESKIYSYANGVSRSVNMICDHSLRIAQKYSEQVVTPQIVKLASELLSPSAAEGNFLKRRYAALTNSAVMRAHIISNKIEKICQPFHTKPASTPYNLQQKHSLKVDSISNNEVNYTEIIEQRLLELNKSTEQSLKLSSVEYESPAPVETEPPMLVEPEPPSPIESESPPKIPEDEKKSNTYIYTHGVIVPEGMVAVPHITLTSAYGATDISVTGFMLDQTPVTNKMYAQYIKETGSLPPDHWWQKKPPENLLNHPVVGISFKDASGFADWCGKRLPTASEWEAAARCPDSRKFPWGEKWEPWRCNCPELELNKTASVDLHHAGGSTDGCLDLVGNVWEWTDSTKEDTTLESGYSWVFGGSFRHKCVVDGAIARSMLLQINRYNYVGFRCARDLP